MSFRKEGERKRGGRGGVIVLPANPGQGSGCGECWQGGRGFIGGKEKGGFSVGRGNASVVSNCKRMRVHGGK